MHRSIPPSPLMSRRTLLQRSGMGLGALALAGLCADETVREARGSSVDNAIGPKQPHFPGRVKRVIHFFLNGGPRTSTRSIPSRAC